MVLKPHNLREVPDTLTLACEQLLEEQPPTAEEPTVLTKLFDTTYEKDPILNDILEQL